MATTSLGGVKFCRVKRMVVDVLELDIRDSGEHGCMSVLAYARVAAPSGAGGDSAVVAAMRTRVASVKGSEAYQTLFGVKTRSGSGRLRERRIAGRVFFEALIVADKDSTRLIEKRDGKILVYLDSLRIFAVHLPDAGLETGSPEWVVMESLSVPRVNARFPSAPQRQ
ncbi:MAG TPA: hypothetical protein VJ808_04075 [Gemmatimonadales bacterium]|nr:hypothetical protein [Gemmatimonadales bacterium]